MNVSLPLLLVVLVESNCPELDGWTVEVEILTLADIVVEVQVSCEQVFVSLQN